jgi:3-hydroxy-9,10-secoandrosta-1,3,5(10)-triene-9,17-dione monooxygenase
MEGKMRRAQVHDNADPVVLAAELRPLLARNAAQAEQDRRLPQENIDALEAANLFKLMTPCRWNGYGIPLSTALSAHAELAKGCASTAWVTMIIGACLWLASLLPDRGPEEIFGSPADLRIAGVISATIKGQRVEGGMRVSGKNGFASGCLHSSWAALCFAVEDAAHNIIDQVISFAPMSKIEIEDTWLVAGMRGTGSNTLVAKDLFIPDHLIFPLMSALEGNPPRTRHAPENSDRWSMAPTLPLILLSPILGAAGVLLEETIEGSRKRAISYTTYSRQADAAVVQHQMAEAALQIDSARLHWMRAAGDIDDAAAAGKGLNYLTRSRIRGECGYAAKLVREAVDSLMSVGGGSAFAEAASIQRMWRDISIASRHGMLSTAPNLEMYGRALLGVEGNITPLI